MHKLILWDIAHTLLEAGGISGEGTAASLPTGLASVGMVFPAHEFTRD